MNYEAGAGRGKQGGPTAKQLADYEAEQNKGIFTAEKAQKGKELPRDLMPEDFRKMKPKKMAKGGKIDGCAQRGKTRGRVV